MKLFILKKTALFSMLVLFGTSCTMVKHSFDSDFSKVKYNPHLKKVKKRDFYNDDETIKKMVGDYSIVEVEKKNTSPVEATSENLNTKQNNTENFALKTQIVNSFKERSGEKQKTKSLPITKLPINKIKKSVKEIKQVNSINSITAGGNDRGLLYTLLVIFLVLVILNLLFNFGWGIIGAVLFVLLIILLLRLLGIL